MCAKPSTTLLGLSPEHCPSGTREYEPIVPFPFHGRFWREGDWERAPDRSLLSALWGGEREGRGTQLHVAAVAGPMTVSRGDAGSDLVTTVYDDRGGDRLEDDTWACPRCGRGWDLVEWMAANATLSEDERSEKRVRLTHLGRWSCPRCGDSSRTEQEANTLARVRFGRIDLSPGRGP